MISYIEVAFYTAVYFAIGMSLALIYMSTKERNNPGTATAGTLLFFFWPLLTFIGVIIVVGKVTSAIFDSVTRLFEWIEFHR